MSTLKDFFEKLQNDETMQGELVQAKMDATIAVASKHGFTITESDFKEMGGKLSDEELAYVSGGGAGGNVCECGCDMYDYDMTTGWYRCMNCGKPMKR